MSLYLDQQQQHHGAVTCSHIPLLAQSALDLVSNGRNFLVRNNQARTRQRQRRSAIQQLLGGRAKVQHVYGPGHLLVVRPELILERFDTPAEQPLRLFPTPSSSQARAEVIGYPRHGKIVGPCDDRSRRIPGTDGRRERRRVVRMTSEELRARHLSRGSSHVRKQSISRQEHGASPEKCS